MKYHKHFKQPIKKHQFIPILKLGDLLLNTKSKKKLIIMNHLKNKDLIFPVANFRNKRIMIQIRDTHVFYYSQILKEGTNLACKLLLLLEGQNNIIWYST